MSDLVERLRIVDSPDYGKNISLTVRREDVSEAATALTAKDKEIEALRAKVTEQRDAMELLARKHMLLARDFDSLNARSDATRRRAETAERRVAELEKHCIRLGQGGAERYWEGRWRDEAKENDQLRRERDEARAASMLKAMEQECWTLRCVDIPTGCGDADVGWEVIQHYQAEPHDRMVSHGKTPQEALRNALAPKCLNCNDANEYGDYECPTCEVCGGTGRAARAVIKQGE